MANLVVTNPDTGSSYDTGIDQNTANAIPNLAQVANDTYRIPGLGTEALMRQMVNQTVSNAISDPVTFEKNALKNYTKNLVSAENFRGVPGEQPPDKQQLIDASKAAINYLSGKNVPINEINSLINTSTQEYQQFQQMAADKIASMNQPTFADNLSKIANIAAPIVIAAVAPEIPAAIGQSLGFTGSAALTAGNAAIQGTAAIAQGAKPEDVAKNIATSAAGSELASNIVPVDKAAPITSAAQQGAIRGATSAALLGKDVVKGAAAGGLTSGISTGLQEGYRSLLPEQVDYSLTSGKDVGGLGLKLPAATTTTPTDSEYYAANFDYNAPTAAGTGGLGIKAAPSTTTFNPDGTIDYGVYQQGSGGGEGLTSTTTDVNPSIYQPAQLGTTEKLLADYVAKDIVRQTGLSSSSSGSKSTQAAQPATSAVTLGSQQSPTATTGADVAALDTTTGEGLGSKEGKKGGKYPWGDPEGTTALKQEGQVI
jgi:hypothetical protein